jgi:hypothetical protein
MQVESAWIWRIAIGDALHKNIQDKHKIMKDIATYSYLTKHHTIYYKWIASILGMAHKFHKVLNILT